MKINLESHTDDIQIQILPLIDVIFCILTFFILGAVGLSRQQAIGLDLPRASTGEAQMREMFMVVIDPIGQVSIEDRSQQWVAVNTRQLTGVLQSYREARPNGLIVLHAHPMAQYEKVVQVLDLLRSVGGERVALATLPTSEPELNQPNTLDRFNPSPGFPAAPGSLPGTNIPSVPPTPSGETDSTVPNLTPGTGLPGGLVPGNESVPEEETPGLDATPDATPENGEVEVPEVESPDVDAPEVEVPETDTPEVEVPETDTLETPTTEDAGGEGNVEEN